MERPTFSCFYNSGIRGKISFPQTVDRKLGKRIKSPSPTFNCVGPAGVGTGSLAGMRILHEIGHRACAMPIEKTLKHRLTLVEIFRHTILRYLE